MMNQNDDEGRELSDALEEHRKQLDELAGTEVVNVDRFVKMLEESAGRDIARRFVEAAEDMLYPGMLGPEDMEPDDLNDSNDFEVKP